VKIKLPASELVHVSPTGSEQPRSAIEKDIDAKGEPALHAHMQWPKLGMQIVMVKVRTLASLQHQLGSGAIPGNQQVNDAYPVALAAGHRARLVMFDSRLSALAERPELVELLQA
jgi:predicted nucleic acid-binding protein